jgi:hypothetical protein
MLHETISDPRSSAFIIATILLSWCGLAKPQAALPEGPLLNGKWEMGNGQ